MSTGEIEITLPGSDGEMKTLVLKPSIKATKLLSRNEGGLMTTVQQIMALNLDTFVRVIELGVGFTETGKAGLDDRIWRRGMNELAAPLVRYVHILANGGKPPKEETDAVDADGEAGGNA
jgi:hypothetical protein